MKGLRVFCSNCGTKYQELAKFCASCGESKGGDEATLEDVANTVSLLPPQRRVKYGSVNIESIDPYLLVEGPISVPADSEEARNSKIPFNPTEIPKLGDLIPLDCVWAFKSHPGDFRSDPTWGSIDKKFVAMGTLQGRTFQEIVSVVGPPMTVFNNASGSNAVWGKTGFLSMWQIGLNFDPYRVCMGVFSETNL